MFFRTEIEKRKDIIYWIKNILSLFLAKSQLFLMHHINTRSERNPINANINP